MSILSGSNSAGRSEKLPYVVLVDDNFHYMDEDERWRLGAFATLDLAVAACKHLVEGCLLESYRPGMKAEELYDLYVTFGDDPFIVGPGGFSKFFAWEYAEQLATRICAQGAASTPSDGDHSSKA